MSRSGSTAGPSADPNGPTLGRVAAVVAAAYHLLVRPRHRRRGATDGEVRRRLPGDELVPDPADETTRAVTVRARR